MTAPRVEWAPINERDEDYRRGLPAYEAYVGEYELIAARSRFGRHWVWAVYRRPAANDRDSAQEAAETELDTRLERTAQ
jgi:hypothetical protein